MWMTVKVTIGGIRAKYNMGLWYGCGIVNGTEVTCGTNEGDNDNKFVATRIFMTSSVIFLITAFVLDNMGLIQKLLQHFIYWVF
jgi:hypothetical protein